MYSAVVFFQKNGYLAHSSVPSPFGWHLSYSTRNLTLKYGWPATTRMFEITSQLAVVGAAASSSGIFRDALLVRGGAACLLAVTSVAVVSPSSSSTFSSSNSNSTSTTQDKSLDLLTEPAAEQQQHVALTLSGGAKTDAVDSSSSSVLTPEGKAVLFMAIGMAFHYFGYSIARSVTVSLFTSETTGYAGNTAAFPFAMGFISPRSLLLLVGYTGVLERHGPRSALVQSSLFCAAVLSACALAIASCLRTGLTVVGIPAVKLITGPLFVFR